MVTKIYDQTPHGNDLVVAKGSPDVLGENSKPDFGVNATYHPIIVGGSMVYGAWFQGGAGYRCIDTDGVATGDEPESMYMVSEPDLKVALISISSTVGLGCGWELFADSN